MELISDRLINKAQQMANSAKDGTLKINGVSYVFTFDRKEWAYVITDNLGDEVVKFNTKSLKQARQWLKEYFLN